MYPVFFLSWVIVLTGDEINELTSAPNELENDDEEETPKYKKKYLKRHKGKLMKKKNLYSREDSSSSDEYDRDCDSGEVLFMVVDEKTK